MCKRNHSIFKTNIGPKSNNNTIIQGSEIHNPVFLNSSAELMQKLGERGQYDILENIVLEILGVAEQAHPLYPDFSAKINNEMQKLVSTPETEDAFQKYPKRIKGKYRLDYTKYPYMDKSETPWEYAYRTQTNVELLTTEYQEYLGDIVDPFPITKYADGMITIIGAPPFPPAVDATIVSGEISIPIKLRRKPCMEYGTMLFGTEKAEHGLHINITAYKGLPKTDVKIKKISGCDLKTQLLREKLINEIRNTKTFCIYVGREVLVTATFTEKDLSEEMFDIAPYMVEYLENLISIENNTGCHFDVSMDEVTWEDIRTAHILASSLNGKWHRIKMKYDDDIHCSYQNIPETIIGDSQNSSDKVIEGKVLEIFLHGQRFSAERYIIIYKDARIHNVDEIIKKRKKRKKEIKIAFSPANGKVHFFKYCMFEDVKMVL